MPDLTPAREGAGQPPLYHDPADSEHRVIAATVRQPRCQSMFVMSTQNKLHLVYCTLQKILLPLVRKSQHSELHIFLFIVVRCPDFCCHSCTGLINFVSVIIKIIMHSRIPFCMAVSRISRAARRLTQLHIHNLMAGDMQTFFKLLEKIFFYCNRFTNNE